MMNILLTMIEEIENEGEREELMEILGLLLEQ